MKEAKRRLQIVFTLFLLVTIAGTIGFMALEDLTFTEALYYNIVTMSTVGYGDIHPTHPASRMFAVLLIVMGGATFLGVVANGTEMLMLRREYQNRLKKINMVLGVFFSETGSRLIGILTPNGLNDHKLYEHLLVKANWDEKQFSTAIKATTASQLRVNISGIDLKKLNDFLSEQRPFLLGLLENPVLIEHDDFSDLLLSVFHLLDELKNRPDHDKLPAPDLEHIEVDINRVYKNLVVQWMVNLQHLQQEYPYLFSLAIRTNPFVKRIR